MDATAINATGSTVQPRTDRGLASLKSEDFFRIMISELRQQDPLKPAETSDMINQVSQIRSIELSGQLSQTLAQLAQQQRTSGLSELLGKFVTAAVRGADGSESLMSGVVTGISFTSDGAGVLELDNGLTVPAADVVHVTSVEVASQRLGTDPAADAPQPAAVQQSDDKTEAAARRRSLLPPWLDLSGSLRL